MSSPVDDALDRLPMVPHVFDDMECTVHSDPCWGCICGEAVATVREELQRLREERDRYRLTSYVEELRAAEAEITRLTEERDEAQSEYALMWGRRDEADERAEAAEAEAQRLREELVERPTLEEAIANVNHWKDKAEAAEAEAHNFTVLVRDLEERVRHLENGLREIVADDYPAAFRRRLGALLADSQPDGGRDYGDISKMRGTLDSQPDGGGA